MNDLWKRVLHHPFDYAGYLNKKSLTFIEHKDEGGCCHSFLFEVPRDTAWKAGQHAIFNLPTKSVEGKKWRAFSLASSPHEKVIRITTTILDNPSDFKQKLLSLQPGQHVTMNGPFGEFHVSHGSTIVGIAGGVGITPFRAIAYEIATGYLKDVALTLIYGGKNNYFTFKEDFDRFAQHPKINIIYVNTPEEVNEEINKAASFLKNKATYFISGSPRMIDSVKKNLKDLGIKKIVNDPFKGY